MPNHAHLLIDESKERTIPGRAGAQAEDFQWHCERGRHESKLQLAFALREQKNKFKRFWQSPFYFHVYS